MLDQKIQDIRDKNIREFLTAMKAVVYNEGTQDALDQCARQLTPEQLGIAGMHISNSLRDGDYYAPTMFVLFNGTCERLDLHSVTYELRPR